MGQVLSCCVRPRSEKLPSKPSQQPLESSSTLNWRQSSAGISSRPVDTLENFFIILNESGAPVNREHWAALAALKINFKPSLTDPIPYLRRAWLLTGRLHPTFTASVVKRSNDGSKSSSERPLLTIQPFDADAWVSKTFLTTSGASASAVFGGMLSNGIPTCHWLPASQEILIRSPHWRIDGMGLLMLTHSFLSSLASVLRHGLDRDPDSYDGLIGSGLLTRSLDDVADAYIDEDTTPQNVKATADELVGEFVQGVPSIGLPTLPGSETVPPGDTAREALRIDALTTAAIVAACRARKISVNSAVHAAVIRVTATYPQHPLAKHFAAFFPVDMRRHLPKPYDGPDYAVGAFSSGLPICIHDVLGEKDVRGSGPKSFEEIVQQLASVYATDLSRFTTDDEGNPVSMIKVVAPYVRRTTKLFSAPHPPELPQIQNPDVSSIGKVEAYVQRSYGDEKEGFEVADIWLGTQMLSRSVQCHVWGFRDELNIAGCFNVSFYEDKFVREFLEKVESELLAGLGIDRVKTLSN
ncbi:hypothetical protein TGAM01_v204903 [Trichoderma gamsii]|uniref:Phthiocerol/phthiodiolone dimycocerosyl transferase C-terminal domain-containing protein n=1 Tax=Trichoderma gamsii TaxID=398673 RepID=A0A2P4ZQ39_9HYPO|nr:hypothetical protein TGAM01_v204903 [Trichoderma gamsii]PON26427.1 hypothetical protein TGAM01_v204903 [Trichoderma gamsii]